MRLNKFFIFAVIYIVIVKMLSATEAMGSFLNGLRGQSMVL